MAKLIVAAGQTYLANHFRFDGGTDGVVTVPDIGHAYSVSSSGIITAHYADYNQQPDTVFVGTLRSTTAIDLPFGTYDDPFSTDSWTGGQAINTSATGNFELTYGDGTGPVIGTITNATFNYTLEEYYARNGANQSWGWNVSFGLFNIFSGDDTVILNSGNDYFVDPNGKLNLRAGAGDDHIVSFDDSFDRVDADIIRGDAGNDTIEFQSSFSQIFGGAGNDAIGMVGGSLQSRATIEGGAGSDIAFFINSLIIEGIGSGNDTYTGSFANTDFETISYAAGNVGVSIDESLFGAAVDYGVYGIDVLNYIENIVGSQGNDTISGTDNHTIVNSFSGGSGNDILYGGLGNDKLAGDAGADTIEGGAGRDSLTGGGGFDIFDYNIVAHSAVAAASRDIITDFDANAADRIDLSTIDAIAGGADDAFTFRDTLAFTDLGQVRWFQSGGNTFIDINMTGGLAPDMRIQLTGLVALDAADFIL